MSESSIRRSNTIVAAIPVGIRPGPVAAGAGSVWVGSLRGSESHPDRPAPALARRESFSLGNRTPTALAVGAGSVWVLHGLSGELSRVEPQFGETRTIAATSRPYASANGGIAVGAGYVWAVYGDSTLARIELGSMRVSGSVLAGAIPVAVVVGGGAVWVANSGDATVQRFDPVTFEEGHLRTITVGQTADGMAFGEGVLWVANRGDDSITRIDPSTGSASNIIRVGDEPTAVAVDEDAVWVANSGDGTISRIDPATNEVVRTIEFRSAPAGIAVADGLVWVAAQAP